ncbi:MAG: Omp28-related outer membrane protein [Bacteroidota bacterium]
MKKSIHITVIACLLSASLTGQVPQTHMALVFKKTSAACFYCGEWGWSLQNVIRADNIEKAIVLQVQISASSPLYNQPCRELMNQFNDCNYYPAWFVNGKNATVKIGSYIYDDLTRTGIKNAVDSTFSAPPLASCSYTATQTGSELNVNTTTEFFRDTTGEYYLSVILIENDVIAPQNGIGNEAHHMDVLRASMTSSVFGEIIATGVIPAKTVIAKSFSTTLDDAWKTQDLSIACLIWKKEGSDYSYVNACKNNVAQAIQDISYCQPVFTVYPNPATDQLVIENPGNQGQDTWISIFNIQGQLFLKQPVTEEIARLDISRLPAGVYLVKLSGRNRAEVMKIVKN